MPILSLGSNPFTRRKFIGGATAATGFALYGMKFNVMANESPTPYVVANEVVASLDGANSQGNNIAWTVSATALNSSFTGAVDVTVEFQLEELVNGKWVKRGDPVTKEKKDASIGQHTYTELACTGTGTVGSANSTLRVTAKVISPDPAQDAATSAVVRIAPQP